MAIIGIDLGTTNSLAAVWKDGKSVLIPNATGGLLTPSAVSIDESGAILVGRAARDRLISHPDRSASGFKRFMGTDRKFYLAGRPFTPEDLSALVLRRLREDAEAFLGEPVGEAVVSVPAYFADAQRAATKRAGRLAGLTVERLVNEPSAAALACRLEDGGEDRAFLVFDFGGGTLDVSVVDCFENVVSVAAVCGDNRLGGNDFDFEIARQFCRENNREFELLNPAQQAILLRQAEQCKIALGRREPVMMAVAGEDFSGTMALTNQKLIKISAAFFQRMTNPVRRALADSQMSASEIDQVVLVGGSCKMPAVRQYVSQVIGRDPVNLGSPDTVVALGAGAYAGMKERRQDIRDMLLTDICPFTLGTDVINHSEPGRSLMSPVIERNSVLPTSKVKRFFTASDRQTQVTVDVYQGEEFYCDDNIKLGSVALQVPPAPRGKEQVDVRFTYDINGILEVEVTSVSTRQTEKTLLVGKNCGMTGEQARARMKELASLKIHPRDQAENLEVVARAERLYRETLGDVRTQIGEALAWFQSALAAQEQRRIEQARKETEDFLDRIEEELSPFDFPQSDPDDEA